MEYIIQGGQLLLSLSLLIVLHEFGHYLPARWFNTRVEKFYLFFDYKFSIFKKKIKDTEWGIGWIPLGGYVKISGMIDESMDKEQLAKPPEDYEFRSKPAWQRLIIMIGGVTVNLVLGCVIYIFLMFAWGEQVITADKAENGFAIETYFKQFGFEDGDKIIAINGETPKDISRLGLEIALNDARTFDVLHSNGEKESIVLPEDIDMTMFKEGAMNPFTMRLPAIIDSTYGVAAEAGIQKNDVIQSVNGQEVAYWDEFRNLVQENKNELLAITVERDGNFVPLEVQVDSMGSIGVALQSNIEDKITTINYGFLASIPRGVEAGFTTLVNYVKQFKYVFTAKGATSVGGFGAIGGLFDKTWNWQSFWENTALISIILAFMNILPIPALDGGHIMFLTYEIISGRKPNEKFLEYAQVAGMIFLLALLVYANGNDVVKLFTGG
ncbi:RIP metalloprotease RseP [Putridiphycobacter roseus]|uniref:Zinc metalloprotease n=1 Tax=Putridiphycobacter roseus TaxID=2219161 RepID=A0A2W1NN56_9FLAO|nr:RIP metalloprotease RseP [Putridiphycobacter roseus]PZE15998.1 RIP metalloprotease RseP [Putridiphycobacter roseus]